MNNIELASRKLNVMLLLRDIILRFHQCEAPIHFKVSLSSMSLEFNRFMSCLILHRKKCAKRWKVKRREGRNSWSISGNEKRFAPSLYTVLPPIVWFSCVSLCTWLLRKSESNDIFYIYCMYRTSTFYDRVEVASHVYCKRALFLRERA